MPPPPLTPDLPSILQNRGLPGFRLRRLEMLNWGTFHGRIHSLNLEGRWSLLVGDNGSGKSTAVDALRTLLVPPRLLDSSFNDAARDAREQGRQKDRTRRSYIRGAWSTATKEDSEATELQYLRKPGEQTVLLAVFADEQTETCITLAQVLWESSDQVHEVFAVADSARSIKEHIAINDERELKRRLRDNGFGVVVNAYSAYAERFRRLFFLPGEGAMRVFNQAIGVKEVGDLNHFIRRHMFEPNEVVAFIKETLKPLFVELDECWKAMKRAERQRDLLLPIQQCHIAITAASAEKNRLERLRQSVEPYYLWRHLSLLELESSGLRTDLDRYVSKRNGLEALQVDDERHRDEIRDSLARDESEIRIQRLKVQIESAESRSKVKQKKALMIHANLHELVRQQAISDQASFLQLRSSLELLKSDLEAGLDALRTKSAIWTVQRVSADQERQAHSLEVEHLRQQRGLIPAFLTSLRERICDETRVPLERLPFVGELVQVREDYAEWRGVIEQLLRGFGISLLVPRDDYQQVAGYVKGRKLVDPRDGKGLRLEFFVVEQDPPRTNAHISADRFVHGRLDYHPEHRLAGWVARTAIQRFRHVCCESLPEMQREPYAVSVDGLIRNGEQHVKDDRRTLTDPANYVLGWSKEAKLAALVRRIEA